LTFSLKCLMHFWRCPMLPCRNQDVQTGHLDALDVISDTIDDQRLLDTVPTGWKLPLLAKRSGSPSFPEIQQGSSYLIEARDSVTLAPELVRASMNMAMTHTDSGASYFGKRLVYGGHVISMAFAQITRAFPEMVTILAWQSCDHIAPVFEGDILQTRVTVLRKIALEGGTGICALHAETHGFRTTEESNEEKIGKVLDWKFYVLF